MNFAPIFYILRSWLNWIEHLTSDQTVGGSSPSERAKTFMFMMSNSKSVITSSFFWNDMFPSSLFQSSILGSYATAD